MSFQRSFSGAPWESRIGYCRALRSNDQIFITGTAPVTPDGTVHAPGDGYEQAIRCLEIIQDALASLGGSIEDVVRTRIFVTDIERWEEYGRAHREFFGTHPPATTLVEVSRLIHADMLIEIEADAVVTKR